MMSENNYFSLINDDDDFLVAVFRQAKLVASMKCIA